MKFYIKHQETGEECELSRDVCTEHPQWVHEQCGTASESELQACLDQYDITCYYDSDGEYKGEDVAGIGMRFDDNAEAEEYGITLSSDPVISVGSRVEAGDGEDHDTGTVDSIKGNTATVRWDSHVVTTSPIANLRLL
jgi:hypothetical protein